MFTDSDGSSDTIISIISNSDTSISSYSSNVSNISNKQSSNSLSNHTNKFNNNRRQDEQAPQAAPNFHNENETAITAIIESRPSNLRQTTANNNTTKSTFPLYGSPYIHSDETGFAVAPNYPKGSNQLVSQSASATVPVKDITFGQSMAGGKKHVPAWVESDLSFSNLDGAALYEEGRAKYKQHAEFANTLQFVDVNKIKKLNEKKNNQKHSYSSKTNRCGW